MDLTPLYELRNRLKAGAVSGCALITEDFRLTRALEAIAPFEKASPVFARLAQGVRVLMSPNCPDRPGILLDCLSMCDAVLTTQAVTKAEQPIEPIEIIAKNKGAVANVPYSVLKPLLEALTTSGSGKYSFVIDTHSQRPELFKDYRVKNAMVAALGAAYSELADQAAKWLCEDDASIIPLLKQGFDPKGKKEMLRRVQVIEHIAKGDENRFYLSILENGEKDIRGGAIYALRHLPSNDEVLIALTKTEKGNLKKTAQWALSRIDSDMVMDYWRDIAAKKPEQAIEFMTMSDTKAAGDLVGDILLEYLKPLSIKEPVIEKDTFAILQQMLYALQGKTGEKILDAYRAAADIGYDLDIPAPEAKEPCRFRRYKTYGTSETYVFSEIIPMILACSIFIKPEQALIDLAHELYEKHGSLYSTPAIIGGLISCDSGAAYELARPILSPGFKLFGNKNDEKGAANALAWFMGHLGSWRDDAQSSGQEMIIQFDDPITEGSIAISRLIKEPLDSRWFLDMVKRGNTFEECLLRINLWKNEDENVKKALSEYFYTACRQAPDHRDYVTVLKILGWKKYDGLIERFIENNGNRSTWLIGRYIDMLPMEAKDKINEVEGIIVKIESGKLKVNKNVLEYLKGRLTEMRTAGIAQA